MIVTVDHPTSDWPMLEKGKNIFLRKIVQLTSLKSELQQRANKAQALHSQFVKEMNCAHLLGHHVAPIFLGKVKSPT
jgi:hypothetical protein